MSSSEAAVNSPNVVLNRNYDTVREGDTLVYSLSVFDRAFVPRCGEDASVEITMKDPAGNAETFATTNDSIEGERSCLLGSITGKPDYSLSLPIRRFGKYEVSVRATVGEDTFTHRDRVESVLPLLRITRGAPLRMEVGKEAEVSLSIESQSDMVADVTEPVGAGIEVVEATNGVIDERRGGTSVTWQVQLFANTRTTLRYRIRAGDSAPVFVTLGPLTIRGENLESTQRPAETTQSSSSASSGASSGSLAGTGSGAATGTGSSASSVSASSMSLLDSARSDIPSSVSSISLASAKPSDEAGSDSSDSSSSAEESGESSSVAQESSSSAETSGTSDGGEGFLSRLFSSLTAFLLQNDDGSIRFTEENSWRMAILEKYTNETTSPAAALTLTPKDEGVLSLSDAARFTLVSGNLSGASIDSNGHLLEEDAITAIVGALTGRETVMQKIAETLVSAQGETVGRVLSENSVALNALVDAGSRGTRAAQNVRDNVSEALASDKQVQKQVAESLMEDLLPVVESVVTPDVEEAVIAAALTGESGMVADAIEAADPTAFEAAEKLIEGGMKGKEGDIAKDIADANAAPKPQAAAKDIVTVTLRTKGGIVITPKFHFEQGSVILAIEPQREFVPGLYALEVTIRNPITGDVSTQSQDFAWGVLAMNTNQDRFITGDKVAVQIGVLDDEGKIVCDAAVRLSVVSPAGEEMTLSTSDGSVRVTGTCGAKDSMLTKPDYEAFFTVAEEGTYTLTLSADTANGTREMTQTVEVSGVMLRSEASRSTTPDDGSVALRDAADAAPQGDTAWPIIVSRKAATRLYPVGESPMEIEVAFGEDFSGTIEETVPGSFEVKRIRMGETAYGQALTGEDETTIRWNGSWKKGESVTLSYLYDAPDISPDFFTVGPLALKTGQDVIGEESRAWQIANDDITWVVPPGPGHFAYKKRLTISNAQVDEDLTDFPLLVKIQNDTDFKSANVQADGDDIRFTTSTGMSLPFETEKFETSASSGSGLFWVKIPLIKATGSSSSGAQIYVLFGSGTAVNGQRVSQVWSNGFAGVYHMSGSTLHATDSSGNGNNGTINGATASGGKADGGAGFNGSSYIKLNTSSSLNISGNSPLTFSAWVNAPSTVMNTVVLGRTSTVFFQDTDGNGNYVFQIRDANSIWQRAGPAHIPVQSGWHQLVGTTDGSVLRLYADGSANPTTGNGSAGILTIGADFYIGAHSTNQYFYSGSLDEIRISSVARSAAWIKFEYQNMNDPLGTVTSGTPSFTKIWDGGGSTTNCSEAANWSDNAIPGATDDVIFDRTSAKNVTWDASCPGTVKSLTLAKGFTGTGTLAGTIKVTNDLTMSSGALVTAQGASGAIMVGGNLTMGRGSAIKVRYWKNTGGGSGQLIAVGGNLTVGTGAVITADREGFWVNQGPGVGGLAGGGHGGKGGTTASSGIPTSSTYGSVMAPSNLGSGGGSGGGTGGGAITLNVNGGTSIYGVISAAGATTDGPSGAGGSVLIRTSTLSGNGAIGVDGGYVTGGGYSAGGGGRIAVILAGGNDFGSVTMTAYGGYHINTSTRKGAAGTIYIQTAAQGVGQGTVIIDNNNQVTGIGSTTSIPADDTWSLGALTLQNRGILEVGAGETLNLANATITSDSDDAGAPTDGIRINGGTLTPPSGGLIIDDWKLIVDNVHTIDGNVTVAAGGLMTHSDNSTAEAYKLNLTVNGDLTVEEGGTINVDGLGYNGGYGPGFQGTNLTSAGHGGLSGLSSGITGYTYGSLTNPTALGSGGKQDSGGGSGGGAVILSVTGLCTVDGTIDADGVANNYGSGAGGSVNISAGTFAGAGTIQAHGGNGTNGTGGGGGRIAVRLSAGATFGSVVMTTYGGSGVTSQKGAAGTIYKKTASQAYGDLIIDNNNLSTAVAVVTDLNSLTGTSATVGSITVQNAGKFRIGTGSSLTLAAPSGNLITTNANTKLTNSGTLAVAGDTFSIAAGTVDLTDRRSTVAFLGDDDGSPDSYTITNLTSRFVNLKIGSGSLTDSGDSFVLGSAITLTGTGTLSAGTLDVSSSNYEIALSGSWINTGGSFNARSGTVRFDPSSTTSGSIVTGGTGSTKAFYNLTFSGPGEIIPKTNDLRTLSGFTLLAGAGHFNNAPNDKNIYVDQNVTMDNAAVDMGDATWTVGGNCDSVDVATFTRNGSVLVLRGTGKVLRASALNGLTVHEGASYTVANAINVYGTFISEESSALALDSTLHIRSTNNIAGSITIGATSNLQLSTGTLTLAPTGIITGSGSIYASAGNLTIAPFEGVMDAPIGINYGGNVLGGGRYRRDVAWYPGNSSRTMTFGTASNQTLIFEGNLSIVTSTSSATMIGNTRNPSLVMQKNLNVNTAGGGSFTWTKGAGTITMSGSNVQEVNFAGTTVEDIVINKTGGSVTMSGAVTTDSFDLQNGTVDFNGQAITTTTATGGSGDFTIGANGNVVASGLPGSVITVGGNFSVAGSEGDLLTLNPDSAWTLTVNGASAVGNYVHVAYSNAGGGTAVTCNSCINGGNNSNWIFPVTGVVYLSDGVTPLANATVALSINGAPAIATDDTDASGTFAVNSGGVQQSGDVFTLYLDGEPEKAVAVTVTDGNDVGNIVLTVDALTINGNGGGAVTTSMLDTADNNGSGDIAAIYGVSGNDLTLASGKNLRVQTGRVFTAEGNVELSDGGDIDIRGTMNGGTIAADNIRVSGALHSSGAIAATDVRVTGTVEPDAALTARDVNVQGVFTAGGSVRVRHLSATGTLALGSHSVTASGNWNTTRGTITGTSSVTLTGSGSPVRVAASGSTIPNLVLSGTGGTYVMSGSLRVAGDLETGTGRILQASGAALRVDGTFTNYGTLELEGSEETGGFENDTLHGTVSFVGAGDYAGMADVTSFKNLTLSGAGTWTLDQPLTVSGSVHIRDGTLVQNNQAVSLERSWRDTGGTFTGSGTVSFSGSGAIAENEPFDELVIDSDLQTVTVESALAVSGSLVLKTGLLAVGQSDPSITIEENFENEFGNFSAGSGSVVMGGDEQTISGSTLFWNLEKRVSSGATWTFGAGDTQSVRGTWTARGSPGNVLRLRSSQDGTPWRISAANYDLQYVDIKDSNNIGAETILAANDAINGGANVNWAFPIIVTVYSDRGVTPIGAGKTVSFSVNGGPKVSNDTNASSVAIFNDSAERTLAVEAGDILVFWLDDEEETGVTVTRTNGTSLSFVLYADTLLTQHEQGTSLTNAELDIANNVEDSDIDAIYTTESTTVTMAYGTTLQVAEGTTFEPNGGLSVDDIQIDGAFAMEQNAVQVSGSWSTAVTGSFTGQNTVTFNSDDPESILTNGSTFYNVAFVVGGDNATWTTDPTFTVTGTQTVSNTLGAGDNTPPVISNVAASPVLDTSAVVSFDTNEQAYGSVHYGTSSGNLAWSEEETGLNRHHALTLTGLTAATLYYYRAEALDAAGNSTAGEIKTFTTMAKLSTAEEVSSAVAAGGGGGRTITGRCSEQTKLAISDLEVAAGSGNTATATWKTNVDAVSIVLFGVESIQESTELSTDFVVDHALTLENLRPARTYTLQAVSLDQCGNVAISDEVTFRAPSIGEGELDSFLSGSGASADSGLSQKERDAAFQATVDKALEIIRKYSNTVSLQEMKKALAKQSSTIEDLAKLVPGPVLGGEPKVEASDATAVVTWSTDEEANAFVEFSAAEVFTGKDYVLSVGDPTAFGTSHRVLLTGLTPGTLYHFRVRSRTPYGTETSSRDFTFATKQEAITILSYSIDIMDTESATFRWKTNIDTDTRLTVTPYRNDVLRPEESRALKEDALTTTHAVTFDAFEAGTLYDVEMGGRDSAGNIVSKIITRFTTSDEDLPPQIMNVRTDTAIAPGKDSKIQTVISWVTNEQSTGKVYYQKGVSSDPTAEFKDSTPLDVNYTRSHVILLPSLEPGQIYSFQIESMDSSGNLTRSKTYTILTPKEKEGVIQVILKQLEETFGWVGNMRQ